MLWELFELIYRISPKLASSLRRIFYEYLADCNRDADWAFMNYGFADLDPQAKRLDLSASDEQDRFCIQLYHHAIGAIDLRGLDVLEVGCGRGGGSSYIMRYLKPRSIVGVDLSQNAITLCNTHHACPGLCFCQGDAESLPFADGTFDVVVNVESSHCYGSMERFLFEVHRVLRANGYFVFADLRDSDCIVPLREKLRSSRLQVLKEETITPNVLGALEQDNERKLVLIQQEIPRLLRRSFQHFAGIKGKTMYESLRNGRAEYLSYVLRKNAG